MRCNRATGWDKSAHAVCRLRLFSPAAVLGAAENQTPGLSGCGHVNRDLLRTKEPHSKCKKACVWVMAPLESLRKASYLKGRHHCLPLQTD